MAFYGTIAGLCFLALFAGFGMVSLVGLIVDKRAAKRKRSEVRCQRSEG